MMNSHLSLEKEVEERKTTSEGGERSGMERGSETLPPCRANEGARKTLVKAIVCDD